MIYTHQVKFKTRGDGEIVDLSAHLDDAISKSGANAGMITVCTTGSTSAISTKRHVKRTGRVLRPEKHTGHFG